MNSIAVKGIKPNIIKAIVLMISLFYLLSPIHLEVKMLLHTIVHNIEMPDNILSHQKVNNVATVHQNKEHKNKIEKHNHTIIDLVGSILEGANKENEVPDALLSIFKIDKHIKERIIKVKKEEFKIFKENYAFFKNENKLCKGYLSNLIKPPKV